MGMVTSWRPRTELENIERRMNDMFNDMFERFGRPGSWDRLTRMTDTWAPSIESHVENGNIVVKADLPGIDPKQVSISVTGNQLTIEGERKHEEKEEEKDYLHREFEYGKFSRMMSLPDGVDVNQVKAHYKDGVLEITMPAPKQMTSKKIEIEE
jgi:HSP20 family protein